MESGCQEAWLVLLRRFGAEHSRPQVGLRLDFEAEDCRLKSGICLARWQNDGYFLVGVNLFSIPSAGSRVSAARVSGPALGVARPAVP